MNGKQLDNIVEDLLFFGMSVFGCRDDTRFLKNLSNILMPYALQPHQNVHYFKYFYTEMKADLSGNLDKWLGSKDINLSVQWFYVIVNHHFWILLNSLAVKCCCLSRICIMQ